MSRSNHPSRNPRGDNNKPNPNYVSHKYSNTGPKKEHACQVKENHSNLVQWGPRKVLSWTNSSLLNEVGHQLQQMFGNDDFWKPIETLKPRYMEEHPEEHWTWIKWGPSNYRAYLLFFTFKGRPTTCILKSKSDSSNYELYFVRFRVSPEIFKGTWWTVEIEEDPKGGWWRCWLEDIWFLCGRDVRTDDFYTRRQESWTSFQKQWKPDPAIESIQIKWKPGFSAQKAGDALDWLRVNLPKLGRATSEIRFWSLATSSPQGPNRKFSVLSVQTWTDIAQNWVKPVEIVKAPKVLMSLDGSTGWSKDSTIFACWRTEFVDVYNLTTHNRAGMRGKEIGLACIPNMLLSRKIYNWFDGEENDVVWVRAEFHPWFGRWVPIEIVEDGRKEMNYPDGVPPEQFWFQ